MATKTRHTSHNGASSDLGTQIDTLRSEVATIAGVVSQLTSAAGRKRVERTAKKLGKAARTTLADTDKYVSGSAEAIQETMRERPLQSALIAFGLGVLLGRLLLGGRS